MYGFNGDITDPLTMFRMYDHVRDMNTIGSRLAYEFLVDFPQSIVKNRQE